MTEKYQTYQFVVDCNSLHGATIHKGTIVRLINCSQTTEMNMPICHVIKIEDFRNNEYWDIAIPTINFMLCTKKYKEEAMVEELVQEEIHLEERKFTVSHY